MLPTDRILGIAPARCQHFVESSNPITGFKLGDVPSHSVDNPRNVVPLVDGVGSRIT